MPALSPLANQKATRQILDAFGLSAKHALGQNFLVNDGIIQKIVKLADVHSDDVVLEIGPGIGTLTVALLQTAGHVISIERDKDLPQVLAQTTAPYIQSSGFRTQTTSSCSQESDSKSNFTLIEADAMDITQEKLELLVAQGAIPRLPNKLVANLPYAISTAVTLQYFQTLPSLESATIMVQREVGQRMMASPGTKDYGAYTVKLNFYTQAVGSFAVGHANFMPAPKVESMVLRLNRWNPIENQQETQLLLNEKIGDQREKESLMNVVSQQLVIENACIWADAAFALRRKTLANSCKHYFAGKGTEGKAISARLSEIFEHCSIDPKRRGETLTLQEFLALAVEIS